MKTTCLLAAALTAALPGLCPGQTVQPLLAQSNWQLAPPFETTPSPTPRAQPQTQSSESTTVQTAPAETAQSERRTGVDSYMDTTRSEKRGSDSYVEGPVWVMTFVRVKSGLSDEYLNSMTGSLKPLYDEEKRRKIILDYKILSGDAGSPQDFNIIIMVQYANLGAMDNLREKTAPILDKLLGPSDERKDMAAKRLDVREIIATKTMREIFLR